MVLGQWIDEYKLFSSSHGEIVFHIENITNYYGNHMKWYLNNYFRLSQEKLCKLDSSGGDTISSGGEISSLDAGVLEITFMKC